MINVQRLFEEDYSNWKVGLCLYSFIFFAFIFDVNNVSVLFAPVYFSFVPLFLFIGAIKFPQLMLYSVSVFLGLMTDLLSYSPLGLFGGLYFLTVLACRWQYRFILAQPFHVIWSFFGIYLFGFYLAVWLLQSLYARHFFDLSLELGNLIYGILVFPLIWVVLFKIRSFFSETSSGLS